MSSPCKKIPNFTLFLFSLVIKTVNLLTFKITSRKLYRIKHHWWLERQTRGAYINRTGRLDRSSSLVSIRKKTLLLSVLQCLRNRQSAFSLKIRLVLISSNATANHDVVITIRYWDQTRKDGLLFFLLGLTPSFLAASPLACLGFACSNFAKKNKRLLAVFLTELIMIIMEFSVQFSGLTDQIWLIW